MFDDQIFQDQCIAGGADTKPLLGQVEGKSDRLGPLCVCISEGDDLVHRSGMFHVRSECIHLVFESLDAGPSAQHKRVVCGDHNDDVDAFRFELVILVEIAGEVVRMAGRLWAQ